MRNIKDRWTYLLFWKTLQRVWITLQQTICKRGLSSKSRKNHVQILFEKGLFDN